ncbi:DUF4296 domain-containing protein [Niabella sp. CJ426]|jgi:hypothetical protein|uniref:DUF4296 domain-containing protein n=1 Tax=unclassified Niabella TaxID=2646634 RepID=UPI003CFE598E
MHRYLYILGLLLALTSCSGSADTLPKEKMEKIMWDVAQSSELLNGYVYYKYPEQNRAALNDAMLQRVFKIHNVTKEQFNKTLDYYEKRPDELKTIIDTVVSRQKRALGKDTGSTAAPVLNKDGAPAI